VPFLRLLIAFALAVALPLQGLAAVTCMCKLHQGPQQVRTTASASAEPGEASRAQPRDLTSAAAPLAIGAASKPAKKHGACPKCAMTCCHASAPAPASLSQSQAAPPAGPVAWMPRLLASWAEPVPDKPPRA
jgi:hypothetical protein